MISNLAASSPGKTGSSEVFLSPAEIDLSCRQPVLFLFTKAIAWLVLGSVVALLTAIKLHAPNMLASCPWTTFGRLQSASQAIFLYGFASQAGFGIVLWVFARLGRTKLVQPRFISLAAIFWNLGVVIGVVGILAGDSTGVAWLDIPRYASPVLFFSYLLIGLCALLTFAARRERVLYPSQWFLFAALFVFPWIFSTASLLLVFHPVRGVFQAAVNFWFIQNFQYLWLGSIGIAAIFYFIPKIVGRPLYSHYLAGFSFWLLMIFGGWGGIPAYAPLPAWMTSVGTVTNIITLVAVLSLAINWRFTFVSQNKVQESLPLRFVKFGAICFTLYGFLRAMVALRLVSETTQFTHFDNALAQLGLYGFFAMTAFGAIYFIIPRLTNMEWPSASLARMHYLCSAFGIAFVVIALGVGGILQGKALGQPNVEFIKTVRMTIPFIGLSSIGGLLLLIGHGALLWNLSVMLSRYCRLHFSPEALFETKTAGGRA